MLRVPNIHCSHHQENTKYWRMIKILSLLQSRWGTYFQCLHVKYPLWDNVFLFLMIKMYI